MQLKGTIVPTGDDDQEPDVGGLSHAAHVRILIALFTALAVGWGLFAWNDLSEYGLTDCQAARKMLIFNKESSQVGGAPNASMDSFVESDVGRSTPTTLRGASEWADGLSRYVGHIRGSELRASADRWATSARTLVGYLPDLRADSPEQKPAWWGEFMHAGEVVRDSAHDLEAKCPWWRI